LIIQTVVNLTIICQIINSKKVREEHTVAKLVLEYN